VCVLHQEREEEEEEEEDEASTLGLICII